MLKTYTIPEPWELCGWLDKPFAIMDPTGIHEAPIRILPFVLFQKLLSCDGKTEQEEDKLLAMLVRNGLVVEGKETPKPYHVFPFRKLEYTFFCMTNSCNYRCKHCYIASDADVMKKEPEFTREQCMHILDECRSCGVFSVEITGGEALLSKQFWPVLEEMSKRHMYFQSLYTNGSLLTDEVLDRIIALGHHPLMTISFDGLGSHDWLRGVEGAEEKAIDAMKRVVAHGLTLRCAINLNKRSSQRLMETCRFLKDLGATSFFFIRTSETPRWNSNNWVKETLDPKEYFDLAFEVAEADIKEKWKIEEYVFNGFFLTHDGELLKSNRDEDDMRCGSARGSIHIAHDGRVVPCPAFEGLSLALGIMQTDTNILQRPLAAILEKSGCTEIFNYKLSDLPDNCQKCQWLKTCKGGCRGYSFVASLEHHGDAYKKNSGSSAGNSGMSCVLRQGGYIEKLEKLIQESKKEA